MSTQTAATTTANRPGPGAVELELESHRRELTGYCYRMLGSGSEAEDAVQETILRAWRNIDGLEARPALRSWLYRIATNVCLDMLQGAQRRARPMDLAGPSTADGTLGPPLIESTWVQPVADAKVMPEEADPADLAALRDTVRLAFIAALQHLPARQRAVLILREVLRWKASEVAQLLDTSEASVNSALQRARATMDKLDLDAGTAGGQLDPEQETILAGYVEAFESYDVASLVTLLADDVNFEMPPFELWLRGAEQVGRWMLGQGIGCKGSRVLTTSANGCPAVAIYRPTEDPDVHEPFNLAVLTIDDGRIVAIDNFLYPELFPQFGLPSRLEA